MKRRGFLSLLGAALAAPTLPAAAAAPASYSRATYGLAVFHARTRAHVSARGLSWCLKVPMAQANAMMAEMTRTGLVTPVGLGGQMRAVSNILQPQPWHVGASTATHSAQRRTTDLSAKGSPSLPDWLRHVRGIARANGHTLRTARLA